MVIRLLAWMVDWMVAWPMAEGIQTRPSLSCPGIVTQLIDVRRKADWLQISAQIPCQFFAKLSKWQVVP
tara:strand:+ start:450 stop:656 length:207 start_codon:yes stop_codon:yes gene_type:complete